LKFLDSNLSKQNESKKMKLGISQINCTPGDIEANLDKITQFTLLAKNTNCEVVVFPEMVDTGYNMATIKNDAKTWEEKPFKHLQQNARFNNMNIICGISEKEGNKIFNSIAAIDQQGELIGKYRKTHLAAYPPFNEHNSISPGNSLEIIPFGEFKIGLMICYDLRFPEIARSLSLKGANVLLLCSAWPFPRLIHWETLIRARAIENQAYFIAANRIGSVGRTTFCGSSRIVDPYGVVVSSAAENRETLIVGEISKQTVFDVREQMPIFSHRREDLYEL
jgi:omega-amidase